MTAITSALVLGLVSGAMLFGHWYSLIDLDMPVDYLRTFVRLSGDRAGRGPESLSASRSDCPRSSAAPAQAGRRP